MMFNKVPPKYSYIATKDLIELYIMSHGVHSIINYANILYEYPEEILYYSILYGNDIFIKSVISVQNLHKIEDRFSGKILTFQYLSPIIRDYILALSNASYEDYSKGFEQKVFRTEKGH